MTEPFIQTHTGRKVHFLNPVEEEIDIEDIAHTLSLLCRYGGHCQEFYSVAQHSVLCAREVPERLRLEALLHDASEAYLVDMPRPIKRTLKEYTDIENKIQSVISKKYGINYPFSKEVHFIDNKMLATEAKTLMKTNEGFEGFPKPFPWSVRPWSPQEAKYNFICMFDEYKELT